MASKRKSVTLTTEEVALAFMALKALEEYTADKSAHWPLGVRAAVEKACSLVESTGPVYHVHPFTIRGD